MAKKKDRDKEGKPSKSIKVSALPQGTVIDHLKRGTALRAVSVLGLHNEEGTVTIGLNLESGRLGVKDLIKVENKVTVTQPGPPLAARYDPYYYGFYSRAWIGYYEPPIVQQYDVVTAETTVFVKDRAEPVWSGTTETFAPSDLKKETTGFAKVVIKALAKENLI